MTADPDLPVQQMLAQWREQRPDLDPEPMALFGRLSRADGLAQSAIRENLAAFGLLRSDFDVLATLRRSGPPYRLTPSQLATAMLLSPAATTHRLSKLESAGLVARDTDPDDGRGSLVTLTPAGLQLVERAVEVHVDGLNRLAGGLSTLEQQQLQALLARLLSSLGDERVGSGTHSVDDGE